MRRLFLPVVMMLCALTVMGADFRISYNVPYSSASERCASDIYHPSDVTGESLPVVVWLHGGGLTGGERYIPKELQTGEYVVVAPSYRLLPKADIDECIDDAAAVLAWVMDSIAAYGGNPAQIFVSGHSAGGYLASMIGFDRSRLAKYGHTPDSIAGLIPFSGQAITHYAQRDKEGLAPLTPTIDVHAPLYHIRKDAPPYIIISGDRNQELYGRYEENAYLWRMLKLLGHPYVYIYELDGYNHGDMVSPGFHILRHHIRDILGN